MDRPSYEWRGAFDNDELNGLHAAAFGHPPWDRDWVAQVERHSLGWATARDDQRLVGFVNVPWDGSAHAFVIDPVVAPDRQHAGIGRGLIDAAVRAARGAGCDWMHVDFDAELRQFYIDACGFEPSHAGTLRLSRQGSS